MWLPSQAKKMRMQKNGNRRQSGATFGFPQWHAPSCPSPVPHQMCTHVDTHAHIHLLRSYHTHFKICARVPSVFRAAFEAYAEEQKAMAGSLGLKWVKIGDVKPSVGRELDNQALAEALAESTKFSQQDWSKFEVVGLQMDDFIKSGDCYFKPVSRQTMVHKDDDFLDDRFDIIWACAQIHIPVSWFSFRDKPVSWFPFRDLFVCVCVCTRACACVCMCARVHVCLPCWFIVNWYRLVVK